MQSGEICFYLKGADVVMSGIVQYTDWLEEECGNMARDGLRTLVVARKSLTEEQYFDFEVSHIVIQTSMRAIVSKTFYPHRIVTMLQECP